MVGLAGIALAYVMYMAFPLLPMRLATKFRGIYLFLLNKWYFDELYDAIFVQPAIRLARMLWQTGDATLIDGVPNGLARTRGRRLAPGGEDPDRLARHVCFRHADRRRAAGRHLPAVAVIADERSGLSHPVADHLAAAGRRADHHVGARR